MSQFDPSRQGNRSTPPAPPTPPPFPPELPPTYMPQPAWPAAQPNYAHPAAPNPYDQGIPQAAYGLPQPAPATVTPIPSQPQVPLSAQPQRPVPLRPQPIPTNTSAPSVATPPNVPSAPAKPASRRPLPATQAPAFPPQNAATAVQPTAAAQQAVSPQRPAAPIPVAAAKPRPVPVTRKLEDGAKPSIDTRPSGEEADPTDKVVRAAPPWLVSTVIHMVLIIVFALIAIPIHIKNQIELEVYAERFGQQVLDDTLESAESLDLEVDIPVLAFDKNLVDDPFAAPPQVDLLSLDATKASSELLETPSIGLALTGREEGSKKALLAAYGGNASTEAAVHAGLVWLKKNQQKDGSWSLVGPYSDGAYDENKVAATAMALLAFQGAGHTHQTGEFKAVVANGWKALLKMQNADGFFVTDSPHHHTMYAQAQATIALCEIYGMTKDPEFRDPAQKAVDFAHRSQASEGGWRYAPKVDADTSVTGWYVMALQSAMMAGLMVESPTLEKVSKFLDSVATEGGSRYFYHPTRTEPTPTMTAEALLCRQYLGWKRDDPRMLAGMEYVLANPIDYNHPEGENVYYWYYATQAAHHMDGEHWNRWNQVMRQAVPENQIKTGREAGSWARGSNRWNPHGGRLFTTCLSIYMLEVYYRHLPIYKYRLQ